MNKWDSRFIELAYLVSSWSKDPSTKCGAVITQGKRVVSMGFNGFPVGISDDKDRYRDRELKYKIVLHAEVNAILFANQSLVGCTLYVVPMPPCCQCASKIIQSGIKRIVSIEPSKEQINRWGDDFDITFRMFHESGVYFEYLNHRR